MDSQVRVLQGWKTLLPPSPFRVQTNHLVSVVAEPSSSVQGVCVALVTFWAFALRTPIWIDSQKRLVLDDVIDVELDDHRNHLTPFDRDKHYGEPAEA